MEAHQANEDISYIAADLHVRNHICKGHEHVEKSQIETLIESLQFRVRAILVKLVPLQ